MIDLNNQNEWQHRDETGMILPWYTKSFLDELVTWDLGDKVVFEYGAGASTLWWARKCNRGYSFENNTEYADAVRELLGDQEHWIVATPDYKELLPTCVSDFDPGYFDIIIVDNDPVEERNGCIAEAAQNLNTGGRLIVDNWDQKSVWVPSDETRKMLADWPAKIYPQEGHADWKTAVFTKP